MQLRGIQLEVGDQPQAQQRAPVDAGVQGVDDDHRRLGMRVLAHAQFVQGERAPQGVEIERRQADRVALQALVQCGFEAAAQRLEKMMDEIS